MDGIIYYNAGLKCLTRLAVSLYTLCNNYSGKICIICDDISAEYCEKISNIFSNITVVVKYEFDKNPGKNETLLNKCRINIASPFDRTIFIDSDTIILKDISDCFNYLNESEFIVAQFSNWKPCDNPYRKRIKGWESIIGKDEVLLTLKQQKSVNTGLYGWVKGAKIFDEWFNLACKNREGFIPDEIACQILLNRYSHQVISSQYNVSCKHEKITDEAKIIHFHGKKHCRIDNGKYLYNSDLWYRYFDAIRHYPIIEEITKFDRFLCKYLILHDRMKNAK